MFTFIKNNAGIIMAVCNIVMGSVYLLDGIRHFTNKSTRA